VSASFMSLNNYDSRIPEKLSSVQDEFIAKTPSSLRGRRKAAVPTEGPRRGKGAPGLGGGVLPTKWQAWRTSKIPMSLCPLLGNDPPNGMLSMKTIPSPSQTKRSKGNTALIEIAHRFYDGRFAYDKKDAVLPSADPGNRDRSSTGIRWVRRSGQMWEYHT